jgi:hypothetical protein
MMVSCISYKIRVVAADKKIVGLVVAGFVAVIWCILMHFSRLFSMLYTVHIHAVSQKASVFNGFINFQIRHNLHFAE